MPRRSLAVLVVMAALAGCSLSAPPVRYFEVRPPKAEPQAGDTLPSIIVPNFGCLAAYDHLRVVIRRSPVEVVTSRQLQWTTVPGRMLAQGLRFYLEGTGRFATVRRDAKPQPPYTIEGQVQVIELSDTPSLSARLSMHVNVRRSADGTVIGEEFVDESAPAEGRDPANGVLALRDLYGRILERLGTRIIAVIEEDVRKP